MVLRSLQVEYTFWYGITNFKSFSVFHRTFGEMEEKVGAEKVGDAPAVGDIITLETQDGGVYDISLQIRKNGTPIYSVGYRISAVDEPPVAVEVLDQASASDFYELFITSATNTSLFNVNSSFSIQRIQA